MEATQIGIEILENSYLIGTKDMCSKLIMQFEQYYYISYNNFTDILETFITCPILA